MKISKRSWHYRLLRWMATDSEKVSFEMKPMNLCDYVGSLVFFFLFFVPMAACALVLLGPILVPMALLMELIERRQKARAGLPPRPPREPRTLLGKWLKAKREKVCPMLEWED